MTNKEIMEIAMQQSAFDLNCSVEDFKQGENKVVISKANDQARRYLELPFFCNLVSYGNNIVASVDPGVKEFVAGYVNSFQVEHCFETPDIHVLSKEFEKYDKSICFMAEYFLPDVTQVSPQPCNYEIRILESKDFAELYTEEWSNALCEKRKHLDVLAAAAFDEGKMIGMAGCSADCDTMWQIGIDVLQGYRKGGIASALTSRLAIEVLNRGKVPFYCAAWSNIGSVRNAVRSGFRPAWVEMTAIDKKKVEKMIK
ncbi:GNAT family N-acetyltransferase [Robinsoniella peoriensis]|uniref:GNAT family N-acetyltransferase n=1 Tax=Robinsoniella peoriensis TaxID=180332 RepID=UPI0036336A49